MALSVETAEALVANYLDGRSLPEVVHKAAVQTTRMRLVRGDVPDYALMLGVPAKRKGWMSRHGHRLIARNNEGDLICPESGWRYREVEEKTLRCLDWPEDQALPLHESLANQ